MRRNCRSAESLVGNPPTSFIPSRSPFIESLGECRYLSPLGRAGPGVVKFKTDRDQILCDDRANDGLETARVSQLARAFEIAGPRERIYFDSFVHIPLKLVTQSRR